MVDQVGQWVRGENLARQLAVTESSLLRYSELGMLGAQWDETGSCWLFDGLRAAQLFLPRGGALSAEQETSWGTLGSARLAGALGRRAPAQSRRTTAAPAAAPVRLSA